MELEYSTFRVKKAKIIRCSYCKKATYWEDNPYRPFCSKRCKLTDLGNWADESYAIAGESVEPGQELPNESSQDDWDNDPIE